MSSYHLSNNITNEEVVHTYLTADHTIYPSPHAIKPPHYLKSKQYKPILL